MDILFIIIVLVVGISIIYYNKTKKVESINNLRELNKYFKNKDFSNIQDLNALKNILEIKNQQHKKSIQIILDDAKHKFDILVDYRTKHKQLFSNTTFLKTVSNCVIDYSLKKEFNIQESIKLLLITLESKKISEITSDDKDEEDIFEDFSSLIEGFILRFRQRKNS